MHLPLPNTSQILTLPSRPGVQSMWRGPWPWDRQWGVGVEAGRGQQVSKTAHQTARAPEHRSRSPKLESREQSSLPPLPAHAACAWACRPQPRANTRHSPADSMRWPVPGNRRIALTPLVCPDHVCSHLPSGPAAPGARSARGRGEVHDCPLCNGAERCCGKMWRQARDKHGCVKQAQDILKYKLSRPLLWQEEGVRHILPPVLGRRHPRPALETKDYGGAARSEMGASRTGAGPLAPAASAPAANAASRAAQTTERPAQHEHTALRRPAQHKGAAQRRPPCATQAHIPDHKRTAQIRPTW